MLTDLEVLPVRERERGGGEEVEGKNRFGKAYFYYRPIVFG